MRLERCFFRKCKQCNTLPRSPLGVGAPETLPTKNKGFRKNHCLCITRPDHRGVIFNKSTILFYSMAECGPTQELEAADVKHGFNTPQTQTFMTTLSVKKRLHDVVVSSDALTWVRQDKKSGLSVQWTNSCFTTYWNSNHNDKNFYQFDHNYCYFVKSQYS